MNNSLLTLILCSSNIAGVSDKLQDENVMSFIREFHVIWLLETKTALKFGVPGYNVYLNPSKLNVKCGGIAVIEMLS